MMNLAVPQFSDICYFLHNMSQTSFPPQLSNHLFSFHFFRRPWGGNEAIAQGYHRDVIACLLF